MVVASTVIIGSIIIKKSFTSLSVIIHINNNYHCDDVSK